MSEWRENEREAWEAAYKACENEVGYLKGTALVTLNLMMLRAYAVEAIMEFQKILQAKAEKK